MNSFIYSFLGFSHLQSTVGWIESPVRGHAKQSLKNPFFLCVLCELERSEGERARDECLIQITRGVIFHRPSSLVR
jgi:hypothetical protein